MFDSTKEDLKDLLRNADEGRLQLPDFQRDYVWDDTDVRSLIASVAKGFPIGALLTLETGGEVEFKPRLLAGVSEKVIRPDELLLDGQQRITSLYQSTFCRAAVRTRTQKGKEVDRFYYIDIKKALNGGADIEDAIISIAADRFLRQSFGRDTVLDLSSPQKEFEHDTFPLNRVFDSKNWFYDWRDYWKAHGRDVSDLARDFDIGVIERIERYKVPIIRLDRKSSREAICLVFERVNVGGKKLDAFELVTAIFAAHGFDLREDWNGPVDKSSHGRRARIIGVRNRRDVLTEIASTDFLQACALLHTRANRLEKATEGLQGKELPQVSCRREALLALPLAAYQKYADGIEHGFIEAGNFLNENKIFWHRDVPYPPVIVALASTFAILGKHARTVTAKKKLSRWFWSVTFGELYGASTETRLGRDVPELVDWLTGAGPQPQSIDESVFHIDRLRTLRSRLSAAYKGLHARMMENGCRDFITGKPTDLMTFFSDKMDIHHIFPQDWCEKNGIPRPVYNSVVNKTPLSGPSNSAIGGDAPSVYLKRIETKQGLAPEDLDQILRSHLIEPAHLRNDDFKAFFDARLEALAGVIGDAMGKPVVMARELDESANDFGPTDDDEVEAA